VVPFNDKLKSLVDRFNGEFPDSKFNLINTVEALSTRPIKDIIHGYNCLSLQESIDMFDLINLTTYTYMNFILYNLLI